MKAKEAFLLCDKNFLNCRLQREKIESLNTKNKNGFKTCFLTAAMLNTNFLSGNS